MTPEPEEHGIPHAIGDEDTAPNVTRSLAPPSLDCAAGSSAFVVLVADHPAIAKHARRACDDRGVVLMWVALPATLNALIAGVTPTHVVIDSRIADRIDAACVRGLEARGVQVRICRYTYETFQAIAEVR
jgi:ActR/RegA family two-component response regulator